MAQPHRGGDGAGRNPIRAVSDGAGRGLSSIFRALWRGRALLEGADGPRTGPAELAKKRSARSNAELGSITQKYLAYFSEENPSKRAILLREYTPNDEPGAADDGKAPAARRGRAGGAAGRDPLEKAGDDRSGRRIPPRPHFQVHPAGRAVQRDGQATCSIAHEGWMTATMPILQDRRPPNGLIGDCRRRRQQTTEPADRDGTGADEKRVCRSSLVRALGSVGIFSGSRS